jgi:transposase InsO family protein
VAMAWRTMEVSEQRFRFVAAASRGGASMTSLCVEFGISRPTGYLWLGRYRESGVSGIGERGRRPQSSPTRTEGRIEDRIVALRRERPDWGARKLAVLLGREGLCVPASTVHHVLLRRGMVRVEDRHPQALKRFEREQPNQLWQMDFKSPKGWDQNVGPLSVLDDATRYVIALDGTWTTRAEAVQERLTAAFVACGLPDAMLMDHGTPWWNTKAAGGWSQLTVWLMKQDIQLHFCAIRHPQTQGKVERFHGALESARRRRGLPEPPQHQSWLDSFRHEYNHVRPHEALAMQTPASRWQKSQRAYMPEPPPWVYPAEAEVHRLTSHGVLHLLGRRWPISRTLGGEQVQIIRIERKINILYRHTLIREIDLASQGSTAVEPWLANPTL